MAKPYKINDSAVVTIVATADISAFDYITHGNRVGVALTTVKAGELVAVDFGGTFRLHADTSKTYAYGDVIRLVGGVAVPDGADTDPIIGRAVSEKAQDVAGTIDVHMENAQ